MADPVNSGTNTPPSFNYDSEVKKGGEYIKGGSGTGDMPTQIIEQSQKRAELRSARLMAVMTQNSSRNEARTTQTTIARDDVQTNRTNSTNVASDGLRQNTNVRQTLQVQ